MADLLPASSFMFTIGCARELHADTISTCVSQKRLCDGCVANAELLSKAAGVIAADTAMAEFDAHNIASQTRLLYALLSGVANMLRFAYIFPLPLVSGLYDDRPYPGITTGSC